MLLGLKYSNVTGELVASGRKILSIVLIMIAPQTLILWDCFALVIFNIVFDDTVDLVCSKVP